MFSPGDLGGIHSAEGDDFLSNDLQTMDKQNREVDSGSSLIRTSGTLPAHSIGQGRRVKGKRHILMYIPLKTPRHRTSTRTRSARVGRPASLRRKTRPQEPMCSMRYALTHHTLSRNRKLRLKCPQYLRTNCPPNGVSPIQKAVLIQARFVQKHKAPMPLPGLKAGIAVQNSKTFLRR